MHGKLAVRQNRNDRRRAAFGRWLPVAVAILGATSGLLGKYWTGAPWWTLFSITIAGAMLAIALSYNKASSRVQKAAAKWTTDARTLLQIEAATRTSNIDPYLIGTRLSRYARGQDPYVARNIDRKLRGALRADQPPYPFVLITGELFSGKTRTAFEAVDSVLPHADLIVPREGFNSIRSLLDLSPAPEIEPGSVVFWLDDVDDFSAATVGLVSRMKALGPTICTVRTEIIDTIRSGTASGSASGSAIIADSRRTDSYFRLAFRLEPEELGEARATYPDDGIAVSIGESLAATLPVAARLETGETISSPGYLLAKAVSDCVYLGLPNDFAFIDLRKLFASYADDGQATDFEKALKWCTSTTSLEEEDYPLLVEQEQDSFVMRPYVLSAFRYLGGTSYQVNDRIAAFLLDRYDAAQWLSLAVRGNGSGRTSPRE